MALHILFSETPWLSYGPFNLVLGGILFGILITVVPGLRYYRRLRFRQKHLNHKLNFYKLLLDAASEPLCWWQNPSEPIQCTQAIVELLGLDSNQPIYIQDIINQFVSEDAHKVDYNVHQLVENHEGFTLIACLVGGQTIVRINGARFCDHNAAFILLTMENITVVENQKAIIQQRLNSLETKVKQLQEILNTLPIAVWCRDDNQAITYCNQVYAGIVDATPQQVVTEGRELISSQRPGSPYQLALKANSSKISQTKLSHIVIEGHRRLVEITAIPALNTIKGGVGYAIDVTDLEEAGTNLAQHIAAHQEILHYLSTPIAVFGVDTRLEFFNHAYLKQFQFEEKWLYQKPTYSEVLQDLRERRKLPEYSDFVEYRRSQLQLFNTLINPIHEMIHQPDGLILRLMIVPHPLGGLLFMFENVTDKLALERRHNTLIAVQKETLDNLFEGIVVLGSDGRLRLSNPAAAKIWQTVSPEFAPGRHAGEILYELRHAFKSYNDWDQFRQGVLTFFNNRQPATDRIELHDGSLIQYSYVPLPDGSHLISLVDISDRWRFEQALRERNEALEQADRIKSDFISHISYELRSPLNTIIGFSEILQNQYFGQLNERQIDYCRGIYDSSQRLLSLINDIIDFASIEAGQLSLRVEQIELDSFLSSLVVLVYNRSNDQGLEIIYNNQTDITYFYADERRLKQAIFNLLMNAIKFTPSGGRIELVASTSPSEEGEQLCLAVVDTGVGIEDDELRQLTQLFEGNPLKVNSNTLHGSGPGIGLSLVKSFIGLHGGFVSIASKKGRGTTVKCYVPLTIDRQQQSSLTSLSL